MPPEGQVQFQSEGSEFGAPRQQSGGFDLAGSMVNAGLVSSRQEAQYIMVGIIVVAFIGAAFFFFRSGGGTPPPPPVADSSNSL